MRPEQQTSSQPRRRQPREIPWRCVALDEQRIVPLQPEGGDLNFRRSTRTSELYSSEALSDYNFCIHVTEIPKASLFDVGKSIIQPVLSTDFCVYEKSDLDAWIDEQNNAEKNNADQNNSEVYFSRFTLEIFSPKSQYWVRFASHNALISKLDQRKKFDKNNPIIGFFSSHSRENCHLIVIEKQDAHGCGCLDIYTFEQQRNRTGYTEPTITHRRFSDLEYSMLDHYLILSDYDVTELEIQAKTLNTTLAVVNELERQIQGEERQLAKTRICASASRPRQVFLRIGAAFFGGDTTTRLNTLNWCLGLLSRSGVLHTPRLNPRLEIWQRANYGRLFLPPPNTNQNALARSEDDYSDISALSDLSNANQTTIISSFCFPWRNQP